MMKVKEKLKNVAIIILTMIITFTFFKIIPYNVSFVDGNSMYPQFHNSDVVLCKKLYSKKQIKKEIAYGDVIIASVNYVSYFKTNVIKRVIALPGDTVQIVNGEILVNGETMDLGIDFDEILNTGEYLADEEILTLSEDEYFVVGDNRNASDDSRVFGPVNYKDIKSKVIKILHRRK